MKKILHLLFLIIFFQSAFAQDSPPGEGKLRGKMIEYMQNRLGLTPVEAEKFQPAYLNYLKELKQLNRDNNRHSLEFQQKVLELRLRYRDQFKPIIGEKRSNEVFEHEREFVKSLRQEIKERRLERQGGRTDKRKNMKLLAN